MKKLISSKCQYESSNYKNAKKHNSTTNEESHRRTLPHSKFQPPSLCVCLSLCLSFPPPQRQLLLQPSSSSADTTHHEYENHPRALELFCRWLLLLCLLLRFCVYVFWALGCSLRDLGSRSEVLGPGMAGIGGLVGGSALDDELKRSNVVRLRGLPFSASESDIADFFKGLELGPDGVVVCVNFQGRSTGQAYVQFATVELANKALERNRQHIGSRYIEVFKGHPADMQGALRMVGRGGGTSPGSATAVVSGTGTASSMTAALTGILNTGIPGMSGNPDMRYIGVVRMRGMPYSCTSADITAFFKGMQIVPDGIFLCTHADGRPTGEAFVEFVNEETAARAMQLHREPMGSRYVELFRSTKGEMMTAVQQRMYGMFSGVGGFSQFGAVSQIPGMMGAFGVQGLTGINVAALQAAGLGGITGLPGLADTSEHVCIKMRGLPYNAGQREIMDFFEGFNIMPNGIHIVMGSTDRPTGEAFVEFISSDEAQRGMERHRQNIGSRYIELFRATKSEMLLATGGLSSFGMAQALDPSVQLLLLQQQAAAGAFGLTGLMGTQAATGSWADMQNAAAAAASFYQRQAASLAGSPATVASSITAFDPSSSSKIRGLPYRTST